MPPVEYLATSYYEHWLFQLERFCEHRGLCSREDLAQRAVMSAGVDVFPADGSAMRAEQVMPALLKGGVSRATVGSAPRFAVGGSRAYAS